MGSQIVVVLINRFSKPSVLDFWDRVTDVVEVDLFFVLVYNSITLII